MTKHHDIRSQILTLAARPNGMHSSDLPSFASGYLSARCYDLMGEGLIFRAQLAHRHTRYFTDKEAADRAQAQSGYSRMRKMESKTTTTLAPRAQSFTKGAEVVYTDKTKFTACPGFKPRFESMAPAFVHSAVQSGRITRAPEGQQGGFVLLSLVAAISCVVTAAVVGFSTYTSVTDHGPQSADRAQVAAQAWAAARHIATTALHCEPDRDADGRSACAMVSPGLGNLSLQCATGVGQAVGCKLMDVQP
jgi:hypothetical protein